RDQTLGGGTRDTGDLGLADAEAEVVRPGGAGATQIVGSDALGERVARVRQRERVVLVRADDAIEDARAVGDGAREDAVVSDVRHADEIRAAWHPSVGAFETDEPRERRRDAERASRVGAR